MSQAFVYKQRQCQKRPDSIESLVQENTGSCPSSLHKTLAVPSEKLWQKEKKKSLAPQRFLPTLAKSVPQG